MPLRPRPPRPWRWPRSKSVGDRGVEAARKPIGNDAARAACQADNWSHLDGRCVGGSMPKIRRVRAAADTAAPAAVVPPAPRPTNAAAQSGSPGRTVAAASEPAPRRTAAARKSQRSASSEHRRRQQERHAQPSGRDRRVDPLSHHGYAPGMSGPWGMPAPGRRETFVPAQALQNQQHTGLFLRPSMSP